MNTNRACGCLLGLACGDALGRPVEFRSAEQIRDEYGTLSEMVGNGTWNQPAGTITDDTDMALCIARSLVDCDGFAPDDVATRFVEWYDSGPFDIGRMTSRSIRKLKDGLPWDEAGQQVWESSREGSNAGNGSVMRCAPLAIAYADDRETLRRTSRESSAITHADPRCTDGCAVLNLTIAGLLEGRNHPLETAIAEIDGNNTSELIESLDPIVSGETPGSLSSSGYVVDTLQTALHDALMADSVEEAIVTAVNRGGDADTVGAVAGAIAGARFGGDALPDRWLTAIDEEDELRRLATELITVGES